jgi:hypothetical protein
MMKLKLILIFLLGVLSIIVSKQSLAQDYTLANDAYWLQYLPSVNKIRLVNQVSAKDTIDFSPTFHVMVKNSPATPVRVKIAESVNYHTTAWNGNTDLFSAGEVVVANAVSVSRVEQQLHFAYGETSSFSLSAVLTLPDGQAYPQLSYCLTPKVSAGFSVGFMGAPAHNPQLIEELWQPLVWTEKRFPEKSYLTLSYQCALPTAMLTANGSTYGVIADPESFPFDLFPTFTRSEFGVALRNSEGLAQPMIWAPVMGQAASHLSVGDSFCFKLRLFYGNQSIDSFHEKLALDLYGFEHYDRHNVLGSLNQTLDRMIAYGMSEYSRFNNTAKGPSYETDIPGAVKVTSALNPLNIAYVTDDEEIFKERFLPMMEFLLSRSNTTYADEQTSGTGQTAYNTLGNSAMNLTEMTALYSIFNNRMPFLLDMAAGKSINFLDQAHERQWRQYIAFYRATGDEQYKARAMASADQYIADCIDELQTEFNFLHHSESSFWVQLAPKFVDLMELYDITGDQKYLDAAQVAARRFARFTWMAPSVPDKSILVNEGGVAPVYPHAGGSPINVAEEMLPAWRLSNFGMHSEAAATVISHRSVFMANHAPYFLKIGSLTNDDFLKKIAKSAIIGRSANFPGYHTNTDWTNVYEKEDFPLRNHEEISSTSMHYNHVWPMMSLLLDYLVTDVMVRSQSQIHFPSEYVEAFANLQSRIYGHRPGRFYQTDSVTLWMPQELLKTDQPELNYISVRKGDTLMIAFTNQSDLPVSATITLNASLVNLSNDAVVEIISDGGFPGTASVEGLSFPIEVSGNGITAIKILGAGIQPALQDRMSTDTVSSWKKDHLKVSFAALNAMYLNMGEGLSKVFIFSAAEKGSYSQMKLKYVINNGDTLTITDTAYPFEFDVYLPDDAGKFTFVVETTDSQGVVEVSEALKLTEELEVTANLSGQEYINAGETARLFIELEGVAPWLLSYMEGSHLRHTNELEVSPHPLLVQPAEDTEYTLVAVTDTGNSGEVFGGGKVFVLDEFALPVFDGMIRQQQKDGLFNLSYAQIKGTDPYRREAFFSFDISGLTRPVDLAAFRLYIYSADKEFEGSLNFSGLDRGVNNNLSWDQKPAESEYTSLGELYYDSKQVPGFIACDITSYLKQLVDAGIPRFSVRITLPQSDVLLSAYMSENTDNAPKLLYSFIDPTNALSGVEDRSHQEVKVFPNPARRFLTVEATETIDRIILTDIRGVVSLAIPVHERTVNLDVRNVNPGIYFLRLQMKNNVLSRKIIIRP